MSTPRTRLPYPVNSRKVKHISLRLPDAVRIQVEAIAEERHQTLNRVANDLVLLGLKSVDSEQQHSNAVK